MAMLWSNDVVLEFVELYRREQLLWDPKHTAHRNRSEVADAWLRIQSALSVHCSVLELKRKKESLMTSFRMHLSKKKKQEGYKTTWFAYALLESFLGGKYECDSTVNQMENEFFTNPHAITENNRRKRNTTEPSRQHRTERDDVKTASDFPYEKKQRAETVSYCNDERREMDECELYGQLLAKKLRKLDEHQRDVAMHEIDNIVFRAKMQSASSQAKSFSPSSPVARKVQSPIFIVASSQSHSQYEDENVSYQNHTQLQDPS